MSGSTPTFKDFNPDVIPYQRDVIRLVKKEYDYSKGTLEILLSGSVGSAKSMIAAHLAVFHCLEFPKARLLLGRKSLPDLKQTIFVKILEHLEGTLVLGKDYVVSENRAYIQFRNGSEIISRSWADKRYKKVRSLELSAAIIEELTENNEDDAEIYDEIKMRVGRLSHVPEKFIISPTNPDSPSSWVYQYFMLTKFPTRHVFYSITTDNPFLPKSYVKQLKEELPHKVAQRMIYGKWIELNKEVIYFEFDHEKNYRDKLYRPNPRYPIWIGWDFNIGLGKPLSVVLIQYVDDVFHIFDEVVIEGMRTLDSCDELANRGFLDYNCKYYLSGDASGKHRDTRNNKSDWDIIKKFFSNYTNTSKKKIDFELRVPISNPKIRDRHNKVNSYCYNDNNKRRLFVYKRAQTALKGLRLTKLKKGSTYQEDDSPNYQHITTAIGYVICQAKKQLTRKKQGTVRL